MKILCKSKQTNNYPKLMNYTWAFQATKIQFTIHNKF